MMEWIFGTMAGWISTAALIVIGCAVAGYFFPKFRLFLAGVAAIAISAASIYAKGNRDRARIERQRTKKVTDKLQEHYNEIERRPDSSSDVVKRMRDGSF